jgi:geranylgeranyl pyrophosphate synthase
MEALLADVTPSRAELGAIAAGVRATGALAATRELAEQHVQLALDALTELPTGIARESLETVALASLERQS